MPCLPSPISSSPQVLAVDTIIMTHPQIKKPQFREKNSSWSPAAEPELEAHVPAPKGHNRLLATSVYPQEKTICNP